MLREIRNLQQLDPAQTRRWFQSNYFDLFIWTGADGVVSMIQLCYDRSRKERAISWKNGIGFFHDGVDDGESSGAMNSNASAIMVTGVAYDAEKVNSRFMRESADVPIELRKLVISKLHEYSITGPILQNRPPRRQVRREDWQAAPAGAAAPGEAGAGSTSNGPAEPGEK